MSNGDSNFEDIRFGGNKSAKIKDIKVKKNTSISYGKVLLTYQTENEEKETKQKAKGPGQIIEIMVKKDDVVNPGDVIFQYRPGCQHPTIMKDMCAECGADLRKLDTGTGGKSSDTKSASVAMVHSIPELKVSSEEAQNLGKEDQGRLIKHRKLVLLVDLDQTLIHTTNENIPKNIKDVYHFQLYGTTSPWYHTRIRPRTDSFIEAISKLYELHICTFGARMYAHTIASFLDPDGKYFSHRILSRDECFDARKKTANLSALFPCGDQMVCIIDDREDVWNFATNLVHVKPYNFFQSTGDINAPPGSKDRTVAKKNYPKGKGTNDEKGKESNEKQVSKKDNDKVKDGKKEETSGKENQTEDEPETKKIKLDEDKKDDDVSNQSKEKNDTEPATKAEDNDSSSDKEESSDEKDDEIVEDDQPADDDDYLIYLEDILKTVHKAYYDLYDQMSESKDDKIPDLKHVIPYVKRKVLQGCHIVFSGVIPTHIQLESSRPFLVARSLGATVNTDITDATTHLVAARIGTAKVNEARRINDSARKASGAKTIHIVTPDWMWGCAERWERVDEKLFPLAKEAHVTLRPPAHCSSPEIAFADRCNELQLGTKTKTMAESMGDPLIDFSNDDIKGMDKEVDDILSEDSTDSESDDGDKEPETTARDSDSNASVQGYGDEEEDEEDDDDVDDSEWSSMAAQFEREFLGDNDSMMDS